MAKLKAAQLRAGLSKSDRNEYWGNRIFRAGSEDLAVLSQVATTEDTPGLKLLPEAENAFVGFGSWCGGFVAIGMRSGRRESSETPIFSSVDPGFLLGDVGDLSIDLGGGDDRPRYRIAGTDPSQNEGRIWQKSGRCP